MDKLFQISIACFFLLGDCSIQKNTSKSQTKYRLKFLQGGKHKEYITHLHQEYKEYVISPPFYNLKRNIYSFQTIFHLEFKLQADIFLNKELCSLKIIEEYFMKNEISPLFLRSKNNMSLLVYGRWGAFII